MVMLGCVCEGCGGLVVVGVGRLVEAVAELGEVPGGGGCVGEAAPVA